MSEKNQRKKMRHDQARIENKAAMEEKAMSRPLPQDQLVILDKRLGIGIGASRERKKLKERLKTVR